MRFIPHSGEIRDSMLKTIGVRNFEDLLDSVPDSLRVHDSWNRPGLDERNLLRKYRGLASRNHPASRMNSYLGAGAYDHFIPSVVDALSSDPRFLTSYTQYQPEVSQGMLEALFEFQTMMCSLTATDVSNASHYDGATALAEAALIAFRRKKGEIRYSRYLNPMYRRVLKTYFAGHEEFLKEQKTEGGLLPAHELEGEENLSAVIVQSPNYLGLLEDIDSIGSAAHAHNALLIACVEPVSLGVVEAPGNLGADLVVGEGQPLGNALQFGGPYFGFLCGKKEFTRKLPGRIVGRTEDREGRPGYVLTLQAREQHIRREKATSNICTNQALCALRAAIYLAYLGPQGFRNLAEENLQKSRFFYEHLTRLPGITPVYPGVFFNEFAVQIENRDVYEVLSFLRSKNILAGIPLEPDYPEIANGLLVCVTETRTDHDMQNALETWKEALS